MWLKLVNELTQDNLAYEGQRKILKSVRFMCLQSQLWFQISSLINVIVQRDMNYRENFLTSLLIL